MVFKQTPKIWESLKAYGKTGLSIGKGSIRMLIGSSKIGYDTIKATSKIVNWQLHKGALGVFPKLGAGLVVGGLAATGLSMLAYNAVNHSYDMKDARMQVGSNPIRPYMDTPMDFSYRTNYRSMNAGGDLVLALHNLR